MEEYTWNNFVTGDKLLTTIESQTGGATKKFEWRDFVAPLVEFCLDENYDARIGIVFGLRATGKTVGMLQVAQDLMSRKHKVAYARFNYNTSGMRDVNAEILHLSNEGYTHFFIDEAPYLGGFLTGSAEWADKLIPENRIKIIVAGTDSFELWLAMNRALYHRYVCFSTNRNTYPEYERVWGGNFPDYKAKGGIFLSHEESAEQERSPGSQIHGSVALETFIKDAIVDNLLHTLAHSAEYTDATNYYTDWLYAIDEQVIFKGVISILKSTVETFIRKNFIQDANKKNIPNLGEVISNWSDPEKQDIKEKIAQSIGIYRNSIKIENPAGSIDALINFLVKIGCLMEGATGVSDLAETQKTLYFAHTALMNYAIDETKRGIMSIKDIDRNEFSKSLEQAAEGSLLENIVYTHILQGVKKTEKVFRYRDPEAREIDVVIIDRKAKTLRLIEIKNKSKMSGKTAVLKDGKNLFDKEIIKNIGIDSSFAVTRAILYKGENRFTVNNGEILHLLNIESVLMHYNQLSYYHDQLNEKALDIIKALNMPDTEKKDSVLYFLKNHKTEMSLPPKSKHKNDPEL
jgi:predicted AAA+ superfamily ATPase